MSAAHRVKPMASPSELQHPNLNILLPPFEFVHDINLRRGLQDCRRTLTVSLGNRLWGDVPSTCRKILENVLIDILTVLRPESAHKIRYKDLHLLVGDFSGYAFPATMGQARLVQVLGNIAAHASRGKFLWTEDRAARLLDI